MSIGELERDVLSLRCWLRRAVLPSALVLLGVLVGLGLAARDPEELNQSALIVGFFALYFVLIRGGHLLMVRSLHAELKTRYREPYEERLARLPSLKGRNAGFALARIKRELVDAGVIGNPNAGPNAGRGAFPDDEDFRR